MHGHLQPSTGSGRTYFLLLASPVTDTPAWAQTRGVTLLRVNGVLDTLLYALPAEEPETLEGNSVWHIVHAVVLVLDPVVVDLDDSEPGGVVARRIPDGA